MPGLDGTGTLFTDLIAELPPKVNVDVASYPTDRFLSYPELVPWVEKVVPTDRPYVLVAESFSTPLAVKFAAANPVNLAGLVLCAGFVTNPMGICAPLVKALVRPFLFRILPPRFLLESFLIGPHAPRFLGIKVRRAIRLANPAVLAARVHAALDCDMRDDLARIQTPTMYILANGDHLVRVKCLREIQRLRPDVVVTTLPAPHLAFQREPRRSAEAIVRFIDRTSPPVSVGGAPCERF